MNRSEKSPQVLRVLNIAFYLFFDLKKFLEFRRKLKTVCAEFNLKGTILVSSEGINGTLAGEEADIRKFQEFLRQELTGLDLATQVEFKESYSDFIPFQKLMVKLKKEIIPLGNAEIQPAVFTAPRLKPAELKQWLDEGRDFELLDTRNEYEIEHGTFSRATRLGLRHFRTFPEKLKALPEEKKKKPLVMFCTGGIRCEKASVAALQQGFDEVYQLDGGILKYFEECGGSHYDGGCFVFDERVALNSKLEPMLPQNGPTALSDLHE
jgi:predicted sulfurtransferase